MKAKPVTFIVGTLLVLLCALLLTMFTVRQSEVAVVTTFGKPTRDITAPGAYFKMPWPIQKVYKFDQRVRNFEDRFTQDQTSDNNNLLTMIFVGWRITDPTEFFPKFAGGSVTSAEKFLDGILRNAKSAVVGQHPLSDFVNADESQIRFDQIETEMRTYVQNQLSTNRCGIEVEFLGIKKLGLPESVVTAVFERMTAERTKLASASQNEGEAEAQKIKAKADREAAEVLNVAQAQAIRIRAQGEAAATASLTTFQQNPELANFLLRLTALEDSLKDKSTLIFDQRTPPFDLFQGFATNRVTR